MGIEKIADNYDLVGLNELDLNKKVGSNLTLQEFCDLIHNSPDGFVTVATKDGLNDVWAEYTYPVKEWYLNLIENEDIGCFNSVNTMYKEQRNNNNIRHLNAFYVDIDTRNVGISKEDALSSIDFLVKNERLPEPTFVIDSGGGLYGIWKIETVPGRFQRTLKLYSLIESFLIEELKELGADAAAKDPARVLRVPGSFNEKYQKEVSILKHSDNVYTMRFFQEVMNEMNGVEWDPVTKTFPKRTNAQKKTSNSKIRRLFNFYTLAIARARDLEMLCKLRDYELNGHRNTLLHIYAYQMMLIHQDSVVANERTLELNALLREPLPTKDLKAICRTVYQRYKEHERDKTKGYNYKNATIIKNLDVTTEEQQKLKTLITKGIKYERNNQRRTPRNESGLTPRKQALKEKQESVFELLGQGLKQKEIAEILGLTKGRVSQITKLYQKV